MEYSKIPPVSIQKMCIRDSNDLTQEECAKIAYIAKNSYIRYEKNERIPPVSYTHLMKIINMKEFKYMILRIG